MSKEASWRPGKIKKPAEWCRLAERLDDARLDPCTAVREHNRPKDRRTVPCDERPEAAIEKRRADGLDVGEVKAHAAGGSQRFGDLVVDLLRVDARPTAIIAQLNDLHRWAPRWRVRSRVSRSPGQILRRGSSFSPRQSQRQAARSHPPSPSHAYTSPNTSETSAATPFPNGERARP